MPSELNSALQELGLTTSERELYLLSLASGPLAVSEIATRLKLQRPYIYTLIQALREKGLAPETRGYQRTFVVESPTLVLELLRKKRQGLENLTMTIAADMPTYLASYRQGGERTKLLMYEGQEKFLELYGRVLIEEDKETLYFGEAKHLFGIVGQEKLASWVQNRVQKKIKIRTLMPADGAAQSIPSSTDLLRETRTIAPEEVKNLPASFQVFGKSVIFWQPQTPVAVVLQDEYIATLMRSTFELLWTKGTRI